MEDMMAGATGEITDIIGVVLNAKFPEHGTPEIYNAIEIPLDGGGRLVEYQCNPVLQVVLYVFQVCCRVLFYP